MHVTCFSVTAAKTREGHPCQAPYHPYLYTHFRCPILQLQLEDLTAIITHTPSSFLRIQLSWPSLKNNFAQHKRDWYVWLLGTIIINTLFPLYSQCSISFPSHHLAMKNGLFLNRKSEWSLSPGLGKEERNALYEAVRTELWKKTLQISYQPTGDFTSHRDFFSVKYLVARIYTLLLQLVYAISVCSIKLRWQKTLIVEL